MTADTITVTLTREEAGRLRETLAGRLPANIASGEYQAISALIDMLAPPPPPEPVEREGWVVYRRDTGAIVAGPYGQEASARALLEGNRADGAVRLIRWTDPVPEPEPAAERWIVYINAPTLRDSCIKASRADAERAARTYADGGYDAEIGRLEKVEAGNG